MAVCTSLRGSKSLKSLCLDSNAIDNVGAAFIFESCAPTWSAIESFSIGYYKSTFDMYEQINMIGADLPLSAEKEGKKTVGGGGEEKSQPQANTQPQLTTQPQIVPELLVVQPLKLFIETAPCLQFCSIKGNRFSQEAQRQLALAAWKRSPNFHFDNRQLFASLRDTPKAPKMEKSRTQIVKHGPLVVNIDSIYRNAM